MGVTLWNEGKIRDCQVILQKIDSGPVTSSPRVDLPFLLDEMSFEHYFRRVAVPEYCQLCPVVPYRGLVRVASVLRVTKSVISLIFRHHPQQPSLATYEPGWIDRCILFNGKGNTKTTSTIQGAKHLLLLCMMLMEMVGAEKVGKNDVRGPPSSNYWSGPLISVDICIAVTWNQEIVRNYLRTCNLGMSL